MNTSVPRILTSLSWQKIAGCHPRDVQESQKGNFDCFEGFLVDYGPTPLLAPRKTLPFRFYIPRGANLDILAPRVGSMVNANQNLMDVLLVP